VATGHLEVDSLLHGYVQLSTVISVVHLYMPLLELIQPPLPVIACFYADIVENNGNHQTINPVNFNYFRYSDYQQLLDKLSLKVTTSYMNMEVDSTLKIL